MRHSSHPGRRLLQTATLVVPVLLLGVISVAQGGKHEPDKNAPAGKVYKNIKVLKSLPANQLIPVMHQFNASLGVRCDFCHVEGRDNFDKDDKPMKGVARQMITMSNDLNAHQKILDKRATCFMCHHGHPEPETKAPEGGPPPPQR